MELSYVHCHTMLSLSEGTYIRIGPSSTTSEYISDRPLESYSEFDHQNDNIKMELATIKLKVVCLLQKEVT